MKKRSLLSTPALRAAGRLAAVMALGFATVQNSFGGLLHHWDFNTNGNDSVGGATVTLVGAATISGGSLNVPGGAVFTDYGSVDLTGTLTTNATLSVECWYTQNAAVNWSKVWMFGADNAGGETALSYIDFTPYTGLNLHVPKIDFDPNNDNEFNAPGTTTLIADGSHQYHVVSIYDAALNKMSMYIDGVLAATNGMGGHSVTDIGFTTARFGSGYYYGDPELNGSINDVRIYNHAVTPLQVAVNFASGPDTVPMSYVPSAVYLNVGSTSLLGGDTEQGDVTADFGSTLAVEVTGAATNWISSKPTIVTVSSTGLLTAVGAGSATISATVAGVTASVVVSVAAVQPGITQDLVPLTVFVGSQTALTVGAVGGDLSYYWYRNGSLLASQTNSTVNFASVALTNDADYFVTVSNEVGTATGSTVHLTVLQQTLDHRYSMDDSTVTDSIGGANGAPINNVSFSGGQAVFPGTNASGPSADYISLPAGLVSGYNSVTFELWATIQPDGNWNQICSFGDQAGTGGNTYLAVIPHSGAGPNDFRMTIKTLGNERATAGATPLDTGIPVHIVAVYNADTSQELLYANGVLVSTLSTTIDIANVNNQNSWLGRSLFNGDAGLKGTIDEFRIWNGPLTRLQIVVNDALGPNTVNTNAGAFLNLASVSVTNATMVGGTSQQATALANFANLSGVAFNSVVTNWASSNTNVATVNASGLITATGQGSALISATALGSTASVTITVLAVHPTITQSPLPQTRYLGGSALFSVTAAGGQLTYQWLKAGAPVLNATNTSFALTGLASGDAADYSVVVTNSAGSITSSIAHLTVTGPPAGYAGAVIGDGPVAYWHLDETSGTNLFDAYDINNGTYGGAYILNTNSLIFGSSDPAAAFAGGTATVPYNASLNPSTFSVEFWVQINSLSASYVVALQDRSTGGRRGYAVQYDNASSGWDFTYGTNNTLFATISSGTPVKVGVLYHVVATYDGTTARLYVNGVQVNSAPAIYAGVSNAVALTLASRNGNNPATTTLDEVSLYGYALSAAQVASHYALGRSGTLNGAFVSNPSPASIQSVVGLPQTFTASVSGQSPLSLQWLKNGTPIAGATNPSLRLPSLQYSDAGSYTLVVSNAVGGAVTSAPAILTVVGNPFLVHRWSFDDGTDSISGSNATLVGTATYSGGQLVLAGNGGHLVSYATVNIASTFANSPSLTLEGWFTDAALANWAKVWMFGISTANYIDFTPFRGANGNIPSMSFNPFGTEVNTTGQASEPSVLTAGTVYHVVAAYDSVGNKMSLYLNGALVATNNMLGSDLTQIQAVNGYFGASLFGDPDLTGSIDEIRVWRGVLSAAQVAANDFAGPTTVPNFNVTLAASLSGGTLTLTWTSGTLLQASSITGPWTPVNGASAPSYSVPVAGAPMKFYRLQVQ